MRRLTFGTTARPGWNANKVREAIAGPGADTRFWLGIGIVATVSERGEIDDSDPGAVVVRRSGRVIDVVLLGSDDPITCRFPSGGPTSTDDWPIHPGDEVLVAIPAGMPGSAGVIFGVMNSAADPLPMAEDGLPKFRNDRRLFSSTVPFEIDAPAIRLGYGAVEALIKGTSYRGTEDTMLFGGEAIPTSGGTGLPPPVPTSLGASLLAAFTYLESAAVGPMAALKPGFTAAKTALENFQAAAGAADGFLSGISKTK